MKKSYMTFDDISKKINEYCMASHIVPDNRILMFCHISTRRHLLYDNKCAGQYVKYNELGYITDNLFKNEIKYSVTSVDYDGKSYIIIADDDYSIWDIGLNINDANGKNPTLYLKIPSIKLLESND